MDQDDLSDVVNTVNRSFRAAIFSMDYHLLRIILDFSKEIQAAYAKKDYERAQYLLNKGFWDIGIYIQMKINSYSSISSDFFEDIVLNIRKYLKTASTHAFTPDNLKRCFKLVELANEIWFEEMAKRFTWREIADALDEANSQKGLEIFLGKGSNKSCF